MPYRVHEWGTFTSMVGTDGIVLEGLQREEESLPTFVHDLLRIDESEFLNAKIPSSRVTQKMETPVLYFHTEQPLRVQVCVSFEQGLMTQFYPLPATVAPPLASLREQRVDMSKVHGSSLVWDIDLLPRAGGAPAGIPVVAPGDPWAIAREVNAAFVRTHVAAPVLAESEHYLFYRGLGRWQAKLELQADEEGAVTLHNGTKGAIPFVAVLELDDRGGRFVCGQPMAVGATQRLCWADQVVDSDRALLAGKLGDRVHKALVHSGLFIDEARAMVATWSRSWFQKDGARVLWLLPPEEIAQVLPLRLQPQPDEIVRVLVGRHEFITPAAQRRVEQALRGEGAVESAERARATAVLGRLDRFLEPHLRNVARSGSDEAVRALAARRLTTLPQ